MLDLAQRHDISEGECRDTFEFITENIKENKQDLEWLVDCTEKFCQDKAIYHAIYSSIDVLQDKSGKKPRTVIPSILQDALAVSFDSNIGHDYIGDATKRYDFYHHVEERIPFDIEKLNVITRGGIPNKSLNIIMGGVGFGKTLCMCHFAATNLKQGYDVLYITMEMAEERIAERIDANLLDINLDQIKDLDEQRYHEKIASIKTPAKLIIKEYPTGNAGAANFRHLLHELKVKKNFIPKIIYIDYLNLCLSSRIKFGSNVNTYTYVKFIAEEIRGLAVEHDMPIWSATQLNREGFKSSDPNMDDTSESFGLPATCDFMGVITITDDKGEEFRFKQLKNRYTDHLGKDNNFVLIVDRKKMRLGNKEENAQTLTKISEHKPVFEATTFGKKDFSGVS